MFYPYPSYAKLFKRFSLLVDEIDAARRNIPSDRRSKSEKLGKMYELADSLLLRLRRLGGL